MSEGEVTIPEPPEDVLVCLRELQEDYSSDELQILYRAARRAYLFGMDGGDKQTPFARHVQANMEMENAYFLDAAYLRIARHYRERCHPHGQRMLQFDATPYKELLRQGWAAFYAQEVKRLADEEPAVTVAILSIDVYAYDAPADTAGDFLLTLLDLRYSSKSQNGVEEDTEEEGEEAEED